MANSILEGLNPAQQQAVEHIEGPLLIVAGPGSGKTRVIAHRIAYLVSTVGLSPYRIAAVTFTNKAARELRDRLTKLMGPRSDQLTASTFHALCANILRHNGHHVGIDRSFVIYDDDDQIRLIKQSMEENNIDPKRYPPRALLSAISSAKSQLITPEQYAEQTSSFFEEIVRRVYQSYQAQIYRSNAVDFDDLLLHTYTLLSQNRDVVEKYQDRYLHLLIDEFQDTNTAQYSIARLLAGKYRNLCVVGDPDQSIYSWRNADIRNILSFQYDYPEAIRITLEENYRSTQMILEGARKLIAGNKERLDKNLFTSRQQGKAIVLYEAYNENEEAQFVAQELTTLREHGGKFNDSAILYRVNAQSRAFEEVFIRYNIPYRLIGGVRFYQRQEVKDIVAYLRIIHNPSDEVSFARIVNTPPRGIGQRTVDELARWSRNHQTTLKAAFQAITDKNTEMVDPPPIQSRAIHAITAFNEIIDTLRREAPDMSIASLIDAVVQHTNFRNHIFNNDDRGEERWDNVMELRATAQRVDEDVTNEPEDKLLLFLENIALVSDVDSLPEERSDAITLITLHQAKGLEFPIVFMVGLEEGLLPHIRSIDDPGQLEEERRLCYVGMTRAQDQLYMVRAFRRRFQGGNNSTIPSRFLNDLPASITTNPSRSTRNSATVWKPGVTPIAENIPGKHNRESFQIGDKVLHAKFGKGLVIATEASKDDYELTVAFKDGSGIKRLSLSFAPLEHIIDEYDNHDAPQEDESF